MLRDTFPDFVRFLSLGKKLIQTHISYIILDDAIVYKIKKPVTYDFLDFSTLASRKYYCDEEYRLNRKIAPTLYKGVWAIVQEEGKGFSFTEDLSRNDIIDYAVVMNRFNENQLLSNMIVSRPIAKSTVLDLSKRIARFHQEDAISDESISNFGHEEAIRKMAQDNLTIASRFIGQVLTQECFDTLNEFFEEQFKRNQALFIERVAHGKIKECHGDLHLQNIALFEGEVQPFDRIEFNKEFRNIDVIYDVAFLYMDLHYRKATSEADLFLNTYLEYTLDYEALPLLPLYACMRAIIRGYVTAMQASAIQEDDLKSKLTSEAKAYFDLAEKFAQFGTQGVIVAMHGVSGTGKSTVARELGKHLNAIVLRSDALRKELHKSNENLELYGDEMTTITYDFVIEQGTQLASIGWNVILDATFLYKAQRTQLKQVANEGMVRIHFVSLSAPRELLEQRIEQRKNDVSDATVSILQKQLIKEEALSPDEFMYISNIDSSKDIRYKDILREIQRK